MRKLNAPIDALLLEPSSIPRSESALSATCLEYDPSMPNRAKQIPSWHTSRCSFLNSFHLKIKNELQICRYCDELQQKSPNNSGENNVPIRGTLGPSSRSTSTPAIAQNLFDSRRLDHECLDRGHSRFAHFNFKVCSFMLTSRKQ
jgi:hypothetical protein